MVTKYARWWRAALAAIVIPVLAVPGQSPGPAQRFTVGGREIVRVDFANTPIGDFPSSLEMVDGIMEVVSMYGQNMLRASSRSVFLVRLPQVLPQDFALEFELVPKAGGNPEDLTVEGTQAINQGTGSAHVMWHRDNLKIVGGGTTYDAVVPPSVAAALPGAMTQIAITMQGPMMKLYTNGRLMFAQQRQFVRGRVLRIFLGGQDDGPNAVYLAGLRVIDGVAVAAIVAGGAPSGSNPTGAGAAAPGQQAPSALNPGANPLPTVGTGTGTSGGTASSTSAMTGGSLAGSLSGGQPQSTTSSTPAPGTAVGVPPQVTPPSSGGSSTGPLAGGTARTPGQTAATQGLSSPTNPLPNVGGTPATSSTTSSGTGNVPTAPTSFKGTTIDLHILLQWAPVASAVSYNIYRKEAGSSAAGTLLPYRVDFPNGVSGVFSGAGTIDPHLAPGVDMTYVVEAVFANGTTSPPSTTLTIRSPAFLSGGSTLNRAVKSSVAPAQNLQQLGGAFGSLVTWTWDRVDRHFGFGIAVDIVPNAGLGATRYFRDFLSTPPISNQTLDVAFGASTWTQAVPANSTVYFCVSRWRLDHPSTAIADIAQTFQGISGSSYWNQDLACERTIVP